MTEKQKKLDLGTEAPSIGADNSRRKAWKSKRPSICMNCLKEIICKRVQDRKLLSTGLNPDGQWFEKLDLDGNPHVCISSTHGAQPEAALERDKTPQD